MLRFIILSSIACLAAATGYQGYSGGHGYHVPAAILSHHTVKNYDVHSKNYIHPIHVEVPANVLPVYFIFRSSSSHINVVSKHEGAAGSSKETHSQDEPHVLRHTVNKPIIQEVREIITPARILRQQILPVREQISTVVARNAGGGGFGGVAGGGFGGFGAGAGGINAEVGTRFGLTGLGNLDGLSGSFKGGIGGSHEIGQTGAFGHENGHGLMFKKSFYKAAGAAAASA